MSIQDQAVQMIHHLSDENVQYLIDFMKRFMMPKDDKENDITVVQSIDDVNFMQELEDMRLKTKSYFPSDFDSDRLWEEAVDEKYGSVD